MTVISKQSHVDILLGAYNGEDFIGEQIDSVLRQTHRSFTLRVLDDGSTDGTAALVAEYAGRWPGRVLLSRNSENHGIRATFNTLMESAAAPYMAFCDQDDLWFPEKIELTLMAMQDMEERLGRETPLMVHTDANVGNAGLEIVAESLWRYQVSDPDAGRRFSRLLLQNIATGCTVMINKALRDRGCPAPPEAVMHDWWLALVAAAFGGIWSVPSRTMIYRQHGSNDTGARRWSVTREVLRMLDSSRRNDSRKVRAVIRGQAGVFLERFGGCLKAEDRDAVAGFLGLDTKGFFGRRLGIMKHGLFYSGFARNVGHLLRG